VKRLLVLAALALGLALPVAATVASPVLAQEGAAAPTAAFPDTCGSCGKPLPACTCKK
jgi:hypothetical protein